MCGGQEWTQISLEKSATVTVVKKIVPIHQEHHCTRGNGLLDPGPDDHAGPYHGKLFLVLVDAHSKWIEVQTVNSTSAESTIAVLRSLFATHGIPEQIVTDNGSGFRSTEFQVFITQNGIKHIFTSPYHPASNGLAERAVQTFKSTVSKMDGPMDRRIARFLLKYRITPQTTTGLSPAQLLMGRRIRTALDLTPRRESLRTKKSWLTTNHLARFQLEIISLQGISRINNGYL